MKWPHKEKKKKINIAENGDIRIITRFLWKPLCLRNEYDLFEYRWLEFAKIKQIYYKPKSNKRLWKWYNCRWAN